MKRAWILALLAAVLLPFGAFAADKKPAATTTGKNPAKAWEVVAVRKTDGAFGFCRAETKDSASGLTLAIALSPSREVNVGIKVPDGGFTKGETFPIAVTIDGTAWSKQATAEAALPDLLLIRLGQDEAMLAALPKGRSFVAKGDVDASQFSLAGSGQMVDALNACVKDGTSGALPPIATGDLPDGLAALLKQAQLTVKPIKLAGSKEANAVDHAWTVTIDGQTLDGGFREARVKPAEDFKKLSGATVDNLKSQCKAGLKAAPGPEEKFGQMTMQTYNLVCGDEFVALITYRTYTDIYGILMHRGSAKQQEQAVKARDRLAGVLRKIGAQPAAPVKPN